MQPAIRLRKCLLWFLASAAIHAVQAGELADLDWWSLKPLQRPAVPELAGQDAARARTVVDRFILAKHREHGLALSPQADRRTLIRRVYFDLIGLPPSPDAVEAFVNDPADDAYSQLVEQLLDSEQYGERWARHWLDVVHYGDTHGYDKDKLRPNAWPYRDYVIRALNEDKPYHRFVREQLAGDVLWPDMRDGIEATGFIAAGPWDFIGHAEVPEEKYDGQVARHLDRDDMVATTMNAFCALTAQCAQCHDHKRDPVTMEDYYSLHAVFSALDRADRAYDLDPATAAKRRILTEQQQSLERRLQKNREAIEAMKSPELVALEKEIAAIESETVSKVEGVTRSDRYGYHSEVAGKQDVEKWVQVDFGESIVPDQVVLAAADEYGFADFGFPQRFRVEVSDDPEFKVPALIADETAEDYPRPGASLVSFKGSEARGRYLRVTATRLWSRRQKGQPESNDWIFALGELAVVSKGQLAAVQSVTALDSIEALPRWGKADLIDGVFGGYPLSARIGKEAEATAAALIEIANQSAEQRTEKLSALKAKREALFTSSIDPELVKAAGEMNAQLAPVKAALQALPAQARVFAGTVHNGDGAFKGRGHTGGQPRPIYVLARGDVRQPGEEVGAGAAPLIAGVSARFALPKDHAEGERRVALADWIVHRDNPLTWRTIVNRVWMYHFGRGIVDTPNDFGRLGQLPTHPELLDWLAVEFRDGKQSIKDLHRLLLNSAVYQQSSVGNEHSESVDAGNQYLWRMNRRKLEAEAMRDSVLLMSGELDMKMYGEGFQDFVLEKPEHSPHYQYHKHDPDDPLTHRRSIYRFLVRSQPQPFMDTLDCADPSLLVDKRNETLTALQALATLNNKFMVRMAEHFAARLQREASSVEAQIARAYELAISRPASSEESAALVQYAKEYGLPSACRVILNLNEFAFVD
jgi:hypothetical protein